MRLFVFLCKDIPLLLEKNNCWETKYLSITGMFRPGIRSDSS